MANETVRVVALSDGYAGWIAEFPSARDAREYGLPSLPEEARRIKGTASDAYLIARSRTIDAAARLGLRFEE